MVCPRCGATFEGRFCPQCGAPATGGEAPSLVFSVVCPRCGTSFQGSICPRCGLPSGTAPSAPPPPPGTGGSDLRRVLSVLWTLSLIGFLVFIGMNFVGLLNSPSMVVPGIRGISSGQNANEDLAAGSANWTFQSLNASSTTGAYAGTGGNPGGYLAMTLPAGTAVGGEWVQPIEISGSTPFVAEVHLDYRTAVAGDLVIAVESAPAGLDVDTAAAVLPVTAGGVWTTTAWVDVSNGITFPGTYYLKVAFLAASNPAPAEVGFDNLHLGWVTDAAFYFYLPLPLPVLLFISQDPGPFLAYYAFIVAAIVASALWYTFREPRPLVNAFRAPLDNVSARLRSASAWVAVGQVWLATMFFQYALIVLFALVGVSTGSPISESPASAWTTIFQLSTASVFEEIAFRVFLIGVPMALGALLWRAVRRGPSTPAAPVGPPTPHLLGALRYLWGGQVRKDSSREARLAAAVLVLGSSTLFGLAHAFGGGWGPWKVLPALVAGLGMGYVFVRHGIGASILVHFATDGSLALYLEGVGGIGLALFVSLMEIGLAIAGVGFFVWYILHAWEDLQDLRQRFGTHLVRQPAAASAATPPGAALPPSTSVPGSAYPTATPPPPTYATPPPPWPPPPATSAAPARAGAQLPQGYAPTYHPPPYGYPPVRFQCPYCGWVEARYEGRTFTCLRCGRTA